MTPEEKQSELQRHRDLILATIDYLAATQVGSFVVDNEDVVADCYAQQKLQTEKYFKQRRLDRLQQRLARLTKGLENNADLHYSDYIKEKTGYEIDIFEDLRKRVGLILSQNEIRNQKELNDIGTMLLFPKTFFKGVEVETCKLLLSNYAHTIQHKSKTDYSEVTSSVEKDGVEEVTVRFSNGPKLKHFTDIETISPDGKRKLRVIQWSDGKQASTTVTIQFHTGASGAIYGVAGIFHDVKALWKDNATIVIETKKDLSVIMRSKEVRSFDDVISIAYIER